MALSISTPSLHPSESAAVIFSQHFCSNISKDLLNCSIPLYTLFQTKISSVIVMMTQKSNNFWESILLTYEKIDPTLPNGFIRNFCSPSFQGLSNNPQFYVDAPLYCFHRILSNCFEPESTQEDRDALKHFLYLMESYIEQTIDDQRSVGANQTLKLLKNCQSLISSADFETLKRTPLSFGIYAEEFEPVHQYRSIIKNYIFLFNALYNLSIFYKVDRSLASSYTIQSQKDIDLFLKIQFNEIKKELSFNDTHTTSMKVYLLSLASRPFTRLKETGSKLENMLLRLLSLESLKLYQDVICSEKAQQIGGVRVLMRNELNSKPPLPLFPPIDSTSVHPGYAENHREVYENFSLRLKEIIDYLLTTTLQAERDLLVLREFKDFLRKGNPDQLIEQLKLAKCNRVAADHIVFEHLLAFYSEKSKSPDYKPSKFYQKSFQLFSEIATTWSTTPKAIGNLLKDKLELTFQWESLLFPHPPKKCSKKLPRHYSDVTENAGSAVSSSETDAPLIGSITSNGESEREQVNIQTPIHTHSSADLAPTWLENLEMQRRSLKQWRAQLSENKLQSTDQALVNAHEHFDQLLCSMRRLYKRHGTSHLPRAELFTFIQDTVRHCTLGVEQLLLALYRETNSIKGQEELASYLTHDLFQILQSCNLDKADLPFHLRRWISEINRGEIIIRDFNLITQRPGALHSLLIKNRDLILNPTKLEQGALADALSAYLFPMIEFLDSTPLLFASSQNAAILSFEEGMKDTIIGLTNLIRSTPLSADVGMPLEIRDLLEKLRSQDLTLNDRLENILNNLLLHLEIEAQNNATLEPIDAFLHLSNVLLLNQMLAESIFFEKLDQFEIALEDEEISSHDLFSLSKKLKISNLLTHDELEFLKFGKASRQFIRYPASYLKDFGKKIPSKKSKKTNSSFSRINLIQYLLKASRSLSDRQVANHEMKGFTPGSKQAAKLLDEIRGFTATDIKILCSIVKKILSANPK